MITTDKTYSIRWYGPFPTKEEVGEFEDKHKDIKCQLYIFHGRRKHARIYESYYCGQAKSGVFRRLSDKGHHIEEIKQLNGIWIGAISNIEPTFSDINYVENILTAQLADTYGEKYMLNKINKKFPKYNIYILNLWHKISGERWQKYSSYSVLSDIPDVLGHEYQQNYDIHYLYGTQKLKWLNIK